MRAEQHREDRADAGDDQAVAHGPGVAVLEQHRVVAELRSTLGHQTGGKAKISSGVLNEIDEQPVDREQEHDQRQQRRDDVAQRQALHGRRWAGALICASSTAPQRRP